MDGPPELLVPILETVLVGALWREMKKFPIDTLERLLPRVEVPSNIRRLVEIWIEEKRSAAALSVAGGSDGPFRRFTGNLTGE